VRCSEAHRIAWLVFQLLHLSEPTMQHSAWVDVHQSHRVHDAN
jgi:hypothetical protein